MNKTILDVPAGIRFISEWEDFQLPDFPVIINKQITGCGFTEWCISNRLHKIVCSPRRILLENKEEQHPGEVLYVKNDLDTIIDVDKDLNRDDKNAALSDSISINEFEKEKIKEHVERMKFDVRDYYTKCLFSGRPCKILVTYDSFRHVKEALGDRIKDFHIVVDEFQSIFTDSRFKSDTEMEFLNYIRDIQRLCFVSATPMMDEYLEMLPDFKSLPYYEMRWDTLDPLRIIKPELSIKSCKSILPIAAGIIQTYLDGNFQKYTFLDNQGNIQEIESKELVVYVNSVKNICDIIKRCGLSYSNTNVLCSNTPDNQKKIRKAFGLKRGDSGGIGTVPKRGEYHKMFTLCTRTVYLGADFYSTCARSLILSDANIECLAVDITLDLPQILGRQRLKENPWKNRAELYFKITKKEENLEDLKIRINNKIKKTENLLLSYQSSPTPESKHDLAENYRYVAKSKNYRDDYVAVNIHGGKDLFPVKNDLVLVSELRAYQIQQIDYKDRFSVINLIEKGSISTQLDKVTEFLTKFDSYTRFTDKMKFLCDNVVSFSEEEFLIILDSIDIVFKNYYLTVGLEKIKNLQYKNSVIKAEFDRLLNNQTHNGCLKNQIYENFEIGKMYSRPHIKSVLGSIYSSLGIKSSPKAVELERYFEIKSVLVSNKETGKRDSLYLIIKKKE